METTNEGKQQDLEKQMEYWLNWQPLSVRRGVRQPLQMHDGIPAHLRDTVKNFLAYITFYIPWTDDWEELKIKLALAYHNFQDFLMYSGPDELLDAIDLQLSTPKTLGYGWDEKEIEKIERFQLMLASGKSVWRINKDYTGLEERVPTATRESYLNAIQPADKAAKLLEEAWNNAWGRHPNSSQAWDSATSAVENLLAPIVTPKDKQPTIGKMLGELRKTPDKWECHLPERTAGNKTKTGLQQFVAAAEIVSYCPGRHGADHRPTPELEASRMVVLQAITVINWLRNGCLWIVEQE